MATTTSRQYRDRQEKILSSLVYRDLQRQKKKFIAFLERQEQKGFTEDFEIFLFITLPKLPEIIYKKTRQVLGRGFGSTKQQFASKTQGFDIDWNLKNEEAVIYINNLKDLHLSQRQGSISRTTKQGMLGIIQDGLKDGSSYSQIAKELRGKDPLIFSKARSELIAIQEVGRAYEKGNEIVIRKLKNKGEQPKKRWITAQDEKVRKTHQKNAADGWIPFDINFSGTNSHIAPTGFRCRCATIYDV